MCDLSKLVKEELSGNSAKSFVAHVSHFHRIQASPMFHQAANYVLSELRKMDFKNSVIEKFPADGVSKYWTYTSPLGWNVRSGELRLLEPERTLLATYKDLPQSLHVFSKATPSEGVTAELVDVGLGTKLEDYKGKKLICLRYLKLLTTLLIHNQIKILKMF